MAYPNNIPSNYFKLRVSQSVIILSILYVASYFFLLISWKFSFYLPIDFSLNDAINTNYFIYYLIHYCNNYYISLFIIYYINYIIPFREDEEKRIKSLGGEVIHWGRWRVQGVLAVSRYVQAVQ